MNYELKMEIFKFSLIGIAVAFQWWAMQPYHDPILARLWLTLAKIAQNIARRTGMLGLYLEHKYYMTVGV